MNKKLFQKQMIDNDDNQTTLAKGIGMCGSVLSAKLNEKNGAEFKQGEILKIKTRWNLTPEQVDAIFFSEKVS